MQKKTTPDANPADSALVRLLLVDDEAALRDPLATYLERQGFAVAQAGNAAEARNQVENEAFDLVLLDIMMPGEDGLSLCRHLSETRAMPVILLTARGEATDRIVGLEIGADDYVVKPFGMAELLARSEASLRRYFKSATENPVVMAGPLSVDLVGRTVSLNDNRIRLTRKEYRLLHILATHVGLVVTHDQLLKEIWTGNQRDNIQYLRILVRKLRQKIESDPNHPRLLVTESGVGYRLQARLENSSAD